MKTRQQYWTGVFEKLIRLRNLIWMVDFGIAVILTVAATLLFWMIIKNRESWTGIYRIYLIVFLSVWAGIIWMRYYRPSYLLSLISLFFLIFIVFAAFIPKKTPRGRLETKALLEQFRTEKTLQNFFGVFWGKLFWFIIGILIMLIVYRYMTIY